MMAYAVSAGVLAVKPSSQSEPRASFLERQEDVPLATEVHEISLPISKAAARVSLGGPLMDGSTVRDWRFSPPVSSSPSPLGLALGEIAGQSGTPPGRAKTYL